MKRLLVLMVIFLATAMLAGCDELQQQQEAAATGKVTQKSAHVQTDADGFTVEQHNVARRIEADNEPGSIKHLYLISPYTGDVLLYSAVKGKVTSGGKRLKPKTQVQMYDSDSTSRSTYTQEVMNDDGTYGSSGEYIYWFDVYGTYHQEMTGAAIIHISSKPLRTKKAVINIAPAN
jgi:hypothetical protein